MKRFFCNQKITDNIILDADEFLHITKVMRMSVGDNICLFNGDGYFYDYQITKIDKNSLNAKLTNKYLSQNTTKHDLTVFQGIVKKPDNQALIVQKMTELGIKKLVFFESEFTNTKLDNSPKPRYEKIVIESCKQSGRADMMQLENQNKFDKMLESLKKYDLVICAYENEKTSNLNDALKDFCGKNIALIIGSEGGFGSSEIQQLQDLGAKIVSLGKTVLRAETACIALASSVLCLLGEWK